MSDPVSDNRRVSASAGPSTATATAPAPTYSQDARAIAIQTPLGKDALLLRSFRGDEGISRLFHFDLDLLSEQPSIDVNTVMGKAATVGVRLADGTDRFFNGVISRIALMGAEGRFTVYRAELVPWTWLLTRTSDCRVFQNLSVPAIVEKVFTDQGFQNFTNRLQKIYPAREYTVQYRETDFNFVSRLMEECGIFYFFEHQNGKHTLVMADAGVEHRPCPGLAQARFRALAPDDYEPDVITSWSMAHEIRPTKYSLTAYNFETPNANLTVNVDSVHAAGDSKRYEVYDYPGDYQKRADGESLVSTRIEEQETQLVTIRAAATCRALASGYRFDLVEYPHGPVNQTYVVTAVSHAVSEPSYLPKENSAAGRYRNSFAAIPLTVPFRPPRVTPHPVIHGVQTAIVVGKQGEELWVDKYGRVKVQFHWDREGNHDENSSCWVRVSQNWAGKRWGTMFLPRIGQEVIVEFLEGDPDCPIITGRVYNGDQTPPYDLPAEQTKSTLKSSSSKAGGGFNELRFEDKKGAEQIFLHGQKDLDFVIEGEARELVLTDRHIIVQHNRFEQVGDDRHLKVGADLVEDIDGSRFSQAKKNVFVKAGANIVLDASGELTLKAPGGFIVIGAEGITIQGKLVNINSGGTAGAVLTKAAKLPHRASSAGAGGGAGIEPGPGGTGTPDPDLARIELYRKAYEENSQKMSASDRKDYEKALAELEDATKKKDQAGMTAAKAKLDAILQKNGIAIPVDPALAAGIPAPGAGTTTPTKARPGVVRFNGRQWVDDAGDFFPLGATLMWGLRGWKFERDRLKQNLAWLQSHGIDYVRILGAVGWSNNSIDPAWPDYEQVLAEFIDATYDEFGMRTEVTCWGGGIGDPMDIANKVTRVVSTRPHKILDLEAGNESFQNGPDRATIKRMMGVLRTTRCIVGASSPGPSEDLFGTIRGMLDDGATHAIVHMDRGTADHGWRLVRQPWDFSRQSYPVHHNEPIGPRSSVAENTDPLILAMLRAMGIFCGVGAFVIHNASGVAGQIDTRHNRPANLREVPGIDPVMSAVRGVDRLLPRDIGSWPKTTQHGSSPVGPQPLVADFIWPEDSDRGVNRNYGAVSGADFVQMVLGVLRYTNLTARDACTIDVFNPVTGAKIESRTLNAGEAYRRDDAVGAYIIRGTKR